MGNMSVSDALKHEVRTKENHLTIAETVQTIALGLFMGLVMIRIQSIMALNPTVVIGVFAAYAGALLISQVVSTILNHRHKDALTKMNQYEAQTTNQSLEPSQSNDNDLSDGTSQTEGLSKTQIKKIDQTLGKIGKVVGISTTVGMAGALLLNAVALQATVAAGTPSSLLKAGGASVGALMAVAAIFMTIQNVWKAIKAKQTPSQSINKKEQMEGIVKNVFFGLLSGLTFAHTYASTAISTPIGYTIAALVGSYVLFKVISAIMHFNPSKENKIETNRPIEVAQNKDCQAEQTEIFHQAFVENKEKNEKGNDAPTPSNTADDLNGYKADDSEQPMPHL